MKKKLWHEKKNVLKLEHVIRPLGGFSEKGTKSRQNEIIIYFQQFYKEIFSKKYEKHIYALNCCSIYKYKIYIYFLYISLFEFLNKL